MTVILKFGPLILATKNRYPYFYSYFSFYDRSISFALLEFKIEENLNSYS